MDNKCSKNFQVIETRRKFLVTLSSEPVLSGKMSYREYLKENKKKLKAFESERLARKKKAEETIEQLRNMREEMGIDYDFV